jgi:hypothetical protein
MLFEMMIRGATIREKMTGEKTIGQMMIRETLRETSCR